MDSPILDTAIDEFRAIKALADGAIVQLADDELHVTLDAEANSIAVIMRHMAGNMRSRWTDFLTTDGEKPDRMRDGEFEDARRTRAEVIAEWEHGWQCVFGALRPLTDADLQRTVIIRGEPHSVFKAVCRQLSHYAGHACQIVMLAKHARGSAWTTLSIPRGQSEEFNQRKLAELKGDR